MLENFPDLFKEAGEMLYEAKHYKDAVTFLDPLVRIEDYATLEIYFILGKAYSELKNLTGAEECYETIISNDESNIKARVDLAKLYEDMNMPEEAYAYITQVIQLRRAQVKEKGKAESQQRTAEKRHAKMILKAIKQKNKRPRPAPVSQAQRAAEQKARSERFQNVLVELGVLYETATDGTEEAQREWVHVARELLEDFQDAPAFYPVNNRYLLFKGYSRQYPWEHSEALAIQDMAGRLEKTIGMFWLKFLLISRE
jgi:general transcription factor 3C polypeptide 3 (transcription factor C subunit 4)